MEYSETKSPFQLSSKMSSKLQWKVSFLPKSPDPLSTTTSFRYPPLFPPNNSYQKFASGSFQKEIIRFTINIPKYFLCNIFPLLIIYPVARHRNPHRVSVQGQTARGSQNAAFKVKRAMFYRENTAFQLPFRLACNFQIFLVSFLLIFSSLDVWLDYQQKTSSFFPYLKSI